MSNPEEVFQTMKEGRDKIAETTGLLGHAQHTLSEAQAIVEIIRQHAKTPEVQYTTDFKEVITAIGKVAAALSQSPQVLNNYLGKWSDSVLEEIVSPATSPIAPPSLEDLSKDRIEELTTQEVTLAGAENLDSIAKAPTLVFAVQDDSRKNLITGYDLSKEPAKKQSTEQVALQELDMFLKEYIEEGASEELKKEAESIRNSLNFIGEKELDKACTAIAKDWEAHLQKNEDNQILVIPGISKMTLRPKSDELVLNKVIGKMDQKLTEGRLVRDVEDVTARPEHTRVIAIDDWTISRDQLTSVIKQFGADNPESPLVSQLEINLVAADPQMIEQGFITYESPDHANYNFDSPVPVKACFTTQPRTHPDEQGHTEPHITGAHSSADFGFSISLDNMATDIKSTLEDLFEEHVRISVPILGQRSSSSSQKTSSTHIKGVY